MQVKEIVTEGTRIDTPRNQKRVILAVDVASNGALVEGHALKKGEAVIEVYEDRVPVVAALVRTAEEIDAYAQATKYYERQLEAWKKGRKNELKSLGSDEARERYVATQCNLAPELFLHLFGLEHGLGPLASCEVVSQDGRKRVSVEDFATMSDDNRAVFLRAAPKTGGNDMERSAAMLGEILAKAMGKVQQPPKERRER